MTRHKLKCLPCYYAEVESEAKPFEIRWNDRDYQVGDILELHEYDHEKPLMTDPMCPVHSVHSLIYRGKCSCNDSSRYTGRSLERRVTCLCTYNQRHNVVVMGLARLQAASEVVPGYADLRVSETFTCLNTACNWTGPRRKLGILYGRVICPNCWQFCGFNISAS